MAGGIIKGFKSHCGGLISKSSDNNPWHYKFSWNPRNVVLAGQGENPIQWLEHGTKQSVTYNELFSSTKLLTTPSGEQFDSYPNRDSLSYISLYNLGNPETFYRGTLRYTGFCQSWQLLVRLGLCDDNQTLPASIGTNSAVIAYLIGESNGYEISAAASKFLGVDENSEVFQRLVWLGLFDNTVKLKSSGCTPAAFLQSVLEEKWRLQPGDTDRVVMIHELEYQLDGKLYKQTAIMDRTGTLQHTAMAETVGLPIAIAVKLIAQEEFKLCGVLRPVEPSIYIPVLSALNSLGICFHHKTEAVEV
jgi:saccharopine dehydrogenase-like NADP-dependent oxidoreductase